MRRGAGETAAVAQRIVAHAAMRAERRLQSEHAGAGADRAAILRRLARHETLQLVVEGQLAARLGVEMHARRPAAGHQQQIAAHRLDMADGAGAVDAADMRLADTQATARPDDRGTGRHWDSSGARHLRQRAVRTRAQIDDRGDRDARRSELDRCAIGIVMRGEDDGARPRLDAVAVEIEPRGIGEHHAGPIIFREDERPFDRAGREHHLARAHLPEALTREIGIGAREMVGDALGKRDEILREVPEAGGAREQPDIPA